MNTFTHSTRVSVLKANSKAINELFFTPCKENKAKALKAIKNLTNFVNSVELPKPKVKEKQTSKDVLDGITPELLAALTELISKTQKPDTVKKPKVYKKPKVKAKAKSRKQSPIERVADRQDKTFHSSEDALTDSIINNYVVESLKSKASLRDGESPETAYRRVKDARIAKAKSEAINQAVLDFETTL